MIVHDEGWFKIDEAAKEKTSPKYAGLEKGKQVMDVKIETPIMDITATKPISSVVLQKKRRKLVISESS